MKELVKNQQSKRNPKKNSTYYQIYDFRILGERSVWGTKDSWKGPYDIKAQVVISLSYLI
jgi:hypothetical protein